MTTDADGISVDFATLEHLSGELADLLQDLASRLETLHDKAKKTVMTWEGEARDACVDALDDWDHAMDDLRGAQRWLHDAVVTGRLNYGAAHQAVLRGWAGA
ncbi:WXG100 family type VII secretion target [Streptantibioticus parmotrematis]|uniref:WXG100 family type VII secretion target n=1 Tax=Streptantibioticus parmotrematis TaxID=2873249 RepID=UPI00340212BB